MSRNPRSISPGICADMERQQQTRIAAPRIFIFGVDTPNWRRDSAALCLLGLICEIRPTWSATGWRNTESRNCPWAKAKLEPTPESVLAGGFMATSLSFASFNGGNIAHAYERVAVPEPSRGPVWRRLYSS